MLRNVLCLALVAPFFHATALADDTLRLGKKQRQAILESVIPAYHSGDLRRLLESASDLAAGLDAQRLELADQLLATHNLPRVEELLVESRLSLVQQGPLQQGEAGELPTPKPRVLLLTLEVLKKRIEATFAEQDRHPVMAQPLAAPATLQSYEDLFFEIHMLDNRLDETARIAKHAAQLANASLNRARLDKRQRAILDTDFGQLLGETRRRRRDLIERRIELQIYRLEDAADILSQSNNTKDRILAARAIDHDANVLIALFERAAKDQAVFRRTNLNDTQLLPELRRLAEQGRKDAGDLVAKSRLLHEGLSWWMRGRYGNGPDAWGLLKSRQALNSPQDMWALYMPATTPRPTDPAKQSRSQAPTVDRRHHYTWAAEYRPILSSVGSGSQYGDPTSTTVSTFKPFEYSGVM